MDVAFPLWCKAYGLPIPEGEYHFLKNRKWRFDWCWPSHGIAVEINGGIFRKGGGAHTGKGHLRDMEKLNAAQIEGWIVLQFTPEQIRSAEAVNVIRDAFSSRMS